MSASNSAVNVALDEGFKQVCVWPGVVVVPANRRFDVFEKDDDKRLFVDFMLSEFDVRVQYLEEILTAPDRDENGSPVENTGGRNDVFFAVHQDDLGNFAVPRLHAGIRWFDDAVSVVNGGNTLYPARVMAYACWSTDSDDSDE